MRAVALGLTVLTGFSGLVYEVSWQRYLSILLGSHGEPALGVPAPASAVALALRRSSSGLARQPAPRAPLSRGS